MATIIDALVVTFGLDTSQFRKEKAETTKETKQLTDAEKRSGKEIEEANKRAGESFKKVRNEVLGLLAIFTAGMGLKNFVESTIMSTAALGRMSQNLDMSAKDLAEWQLANKNAGGSVQGITKALQDSQQAVAKFKIGQVGDDVQAFLRWGGNVSDLKNGNSYLLARANIIHSMFQTDPGKARLVAQQMGIDDDSFNLLKQGAAGIQKLREQQARLAEEQASASAPAEALRKQFDTLENTFQSIGVRVLTDLMPVFDRLIVYMQRVADWVSDHKEDISKWVDSAVTAIQDFVKWADKAAESVGGWKNVLIALAGIKILSMVSPILSLAAALGGLGSSLGIIGTAGPAAIAALAGLGIAKALGLPDTDKSKGKEDVKRGDWLAASTDLPAADFIKAAADHFTNALSDKLGNSSNLRQKAGPDAVQAALRTQWKYGVPADVTLAQFGLESGFGKSMPSGSNNPFGIKAQKGRPYVEAWTTENVNGVNQRVLAKFAKFDSLADAFDAHAKLLATAPAYAEARKHQDDPMAYASALTGHYATDPLYGSKLQAMIRGSNAGAVNAAQIAAQAPGARDATTSTSNVSTSTSTAETHVTGPITINTKATDAAGIARDLHGAIGQYNFTVPQANTGVS